MNNAMNFSESEVIRNFDYVTRTSKSRVVLMYSDYSQEPLAQVCDQICCELTEVYNRKVLVISLDDSIPECRFIRTIQSLNLKDDKELSIYVDESKKFYDLIIILNKTLKNINHTTIPELDIDSAYLVRSSKSIGLKKKRYVSQLVSDANIKVEGVIYAE